MMRPIFRFACAVSAVETSRTRLVDLRRDRPEALLQRIDLLLCECQLCV